MFAASRLSPRSTRPQGWFLSRASGPSRRRRSSRSRPALWPRCATGLTGPSRSALGTRPSLARLNVSASCVARAAGLASPRRSFSNGTLGWVDATSENIRIERTRWSIPCRRLQPHGRPAPRWQAGPAPQRRSRPSRLADADRPLRRHRQALRRQLRRLLRLLRPGDLRHSAEHPARLDRRQPDGDPGTGDPGSIGAASSAGCLRAADDDLQVLMRSVPVGTPVVIRR